MKRKLFENDVNACKTNVANPNFVKKKKKKKRQKEESHFAVDPTWPTPFPLCQLFLPLWTPLIPHIPKASLSIYLFPLSLSVQKQRR
jgi:hypothetical protein